MSQYLWEYPGASEKNELMLKEVGAMSSITSRRVCMQGKTNLQSGGCLLKPMSDAFFAVSP